MICDREAHPLFGSRSTNPSGTGIRLRCHRLHKMCADMRVVRTPRVAFKRLLDGHRQVELTNLALRKSMHAEEPPIISISRC